MSQQNKNILLVMGKPNTGKSSSLRNMNQQSMVYLNTDLKELPFRGNFAGAVEIADAMDIFDYIQQVEDEPSVTGAVLDTLTFLMSMYERQYVVPASDTQRAWGEYGNFYRSFIHAIKAGTKDYVILAHEDTTLNEQSMSMETRVPVKGAVGRVGVEADFTTIVSAKQMAVAKLKDHQNELLHITPEEEEDGVKYVFCTRITKEFQGEKMRSPIGLWKREELFIDNDAQQIFDRLKQYYA